MLIWDIQSNHIKDDSVVWLYNCAPQPNSFNLRNRNISHMSTSQSDSDNIQYKYTDSVEDTIHKSLSLAHKSRSNPQRFNTLPETLSRKITIKEDCLDTHHDLFGFRDEYRPHQHTQNMVSLYWDDMVISNMPKL